MTVASKTSTARVQASIERALELHEKSGAIEILDLAYTPMGLHRGGFRVRLVDAPSSEQIQETRNWRETHLLVLGLARGAQCEWELQQAERSC